MRKRQRSLVVMLAGDEMYKLHALAEAGDESIARVVRKWVALHYAAQFGEASPPVVALKNTRTGT